MGAEHEQTPPTGFPEPRDVDPGDRSRDPKPHHALNDPATDTDPTEWPDPHDAAPFDADQVDD